MVNLKKLEKNLDDALEKETSDTLENWLDKQREESKKYDGLYYSIRRFVIDTYWKIRHIPHGISNIIKWGPTIYNDHDWDHIYIFKILLTKIRHMRHRTEKIKFYAGWNNEVKWMKMCEYLMEYIIKSKAWEDEEEEKYLNCKNSEYYKFLVENIINGDVKDLKHYKCDIREGKAQRLLWKILSWRSPYWWD